MLKQLQKDLQTTGAIRFKVKIIPKSSRNEIVGMLGEDTLKIKIMAVPAKNKANKELIDYLSETFKVPKRSITIKSGTTSPLKTIIITA